MLVMAEKKKLVVLAFVVILLLSNITFLVQVKGETNGDSRSTLSTSNDKNTNEKDTVEPTTDLDVSTVISSNRHSVASASSGKTPSDSSSSSLDSLNEKNINKPLKGSVSFEEKLSIPIYPNLILFKNFLEKIREFFTSKSIHDNEVSSSNHEKKEFWAVIVGPYSGGEDFTNPALYFRKILLTNGWEADHIKTVLCHNASLENITSTIDWVAEHDHPSDTTLLFFIDHGSEYMFTLDQQFITYSELNEHINHLHSSGIGVIIEACYSGSAIPILQHKGRVIITSCRADEQGGTNPDFLNGLFGFADKMKGVGNNNGWVSLEENYNYFIEEYNKLEMSYHPEIEDDYPGDLNIINLKNQLDQCTNPSNFYNASIYVSGNGPIGGQVAQSFIPSFNVLTHIVLHISAFDITTYPLTISIRDDLTSNDLASYYFSASDQELHSGSNAQFLNINIPDLEVVPGHTYYIIAKTSPESLDQIQYIWCGKTYDCYPQGRAYCSHDGGLTWLIPNQCSDLFFATYGYNNSLYHTFTVDAGKRYSGVIDEPIQFSGFAAGGIFPYIWFWDFGDHTTSTEQDPIHTYRTSGTYNVRLTVMDQHGNGTQKSTITSAKINLATEIHGPYTSEINQDVQFYGTVRDGSSLYSWNWNFGDGEFSNKQNPIHNYKTAQIFSASLIVIDQLGNIGEAMTPVSVLNPVVYVDDDFNQNTTGWGVDHFSLIQDGINAVSRSGTVYVNDGTYHENIVIRKPLSLLGNTQHPIVIVGNGFNHIIQILSTCGVQISGFSLCNSGAPKAGIYMDYSSSIMMSNNIVTNCTYGIIVKFSAVTLIMYNLLVNNTETGLLLDHSFDIQVRMNTILRNHQIGIYISHTNPDTNCVNSNRVSLNNFIDNVCSANSTGNNTNWEDGNPPLGNYWSDYIGTDNDGDGIGDTPYMISGGSGEMDHDPLMHPINNGIGGK